MENLQQIPGETDLDTPMPDDRAISEEDRLGRKDYPLPSDQEPPAPVTEPPPGEDENKAPMDETGNEPKRIM